MMLELPVSKIFVSVESQLDSVYEQTKREIANNWVIELTKLGSQE